MVRDYVHRIGRTERIHVLRLKPNSDLLDSIKDFAEREGIKAGIIVSGTGLLKRARLRNCKSFPKDFPITDENRAYMEFERPLELLSLSGNISEAEGKPSVHAHVVLSFVDSDRIITIGGHLIEGCLIYGFAEVFIMELGSIKMEKSFDKVTKTLQLFVE
jgi:predicted DNA-binding protein with PD1-like motif